MMRRIVILAILIVVLATLMNLATALGFWWIGQRPPTPTVDNAGDGIVDLRPQEVAVWRDRRGNDWPLEPEVASMYKYLGITFRSLIWINLEWSEPEDDPASKVTNRDSYSIDIVAIGWPMRCVAGEQWKEWHGLNTKQQFTSGLSQALGYQWPNRMIWPGMIVNELFYCTVIVLSFVGWIQGRRAIRRRRGRCPQCAYDLRGDLSSVCPECGWKRVEVSA